MIVAEKESTLVGVPDITPVSELSDNPEGSEAMTWAEHIYKEFVKPLSPYFSVYVLWDTNNLLGYKQSPTDCGKDVLLKLMKNKIYVPSSE